MRIHVCMSIAGLERKLSQFKRANKRRLRCYDSFGVSDKEVYESIAEYKAKGWDAIPSEGCDNVDERGHCKGHE